MDSLLGVAARLLVGAPFIQFGYEAASNPGPRVGMAAPLLDKVREVAPIPVDNEAIVRVNGGMQAVGGALIATGLAPRAGAAAIFASLVPTTAAGHPYWTYDDPVARSQHRIHFMKNLTMAGGLLAVAAAARRG